MSLGISNQIIIQQYNIKHEIRENDHMSQGFFYIMRIKK
jgi:hypothetical protein